MRGSQDKLYTAILHSIFLQGKNHELLRQMHTQVCAKKSSTLDLTKLTDTILKFLRLFGPMLQPYILAILAWAGAVALAIWKLVRSYLGL